jgi:hypothetical protein
MKDKKMRLITSIVSLIIIGTLVLMLPGCTEADRVNHNLTKQANYFDCERRVTVYNARTDKVILYIEGYIDISNNTSNELVITAKTGNDTYKKNYVYLNEYTLYVVEDISGTHTDPYHYKVVFDTNVAPDIEVK